MTAWTTAETDVVVWSASESDGSTADDLRVGYAIDLNLWGSPSPIQNVHTAATWGQTEYIFSNSSDAPSLYFTKSRATSFGGHASVQDGDGLGNIYFGADDGVTYDNVCAAINVNVDGTPSAGNVPGRMSFLVSPDGGSSGVFALVEALRINNDQSSDFAGTVNITPAFDSFEQGLHVANLVNSDHAITADFNYNYIVAANDSTVASNTSFTTSALYVELDTGGPNINNEKCAGRFLAQYTISGILTPNDLIGVITEAIGTVNAGGTNTGAGAKGTVYGINPIGQLTSGATNYLVCSGAEFDAFISTGATAAHRWGISIPGGGNVAGAVSDGAVQIGGVGTSWNNGILLSNANGGAPIATAGSVIGSDGSSVTAQNFAYLPTYTFTSYIFSFQGFAVTGAGNLTANTLASTAPTTQTGATYTVSSVDSSVIANRAGTVTLTLPAAASYPGRWLTVKTTQAQTVVSATSNVVPLLGGSAATAILAATAGKWAQLQSDGTNWIIMAAN